MEKVTAEIPKKVLDAMAIVVDSYIDFEHDRYSEGKEDNIYQECLLVETWLRANRLLIQGE